MKKLKRFFLKIPYAFYWVWTKLILMRPISFNDWLLKHGFWRLATYLQDLKLLVPKEYLDFVKKFPDMPPYVILPKTDTNPNDNIHYLGKERKP
jgi:hypothetical protein